MMDTRTSMNKTAFWTGRWLWIPAILYSAGIVYLSSKTSPPVPERVLQINDKVLHIVLYAGFGYLWHGVLSSRFRRSGTPAWDWGATLLFGFLFAVADEWRQSFVPGRYAEVMDVVADTVGVALGAAVFRWVIPGRFLRRVR